MQMLSKGCSILLVQPFIVFPEIWSDCKSADIRIITVKNLLSEFFESKFLYSSIHVFNIFCEFQSVLCNYQPFWMTLSVISAQTWLTFFTKYWKKWNQPWSYKTRFGSKLLTVKLYQNKLFKVAKRESYSISNFSCINKIITYKFF